MRIRFSDGSLYDQTGQINFVDVTVDRATDTVLVRATMPNPKGTLIDGQLVRVSVEADKPEEKVLVPQSALIVDQQGTYVFVVVDGKAAIRRVKLGGESGAYVDRGRRAQGRRAGGRAGHGKPAPRHAGRGQPGAGAAQRELTACSPPSSSTGRGWRRSSPSSRPSPGLLSLLVIPIAQYPDIVPPQVSVTTTYPGASAAVVEATVAQPIESQVVGVDKMIYMKSVSGNDGSYSLKVSFELGTDPDINTVNVNNRVQVALSKLPEDVRQAGRDGEEAVVRAAWRHRALFAEADATTSCSSRTMRRSTCSTRSGARRASAMPRCSVRRTTRCGPGCAPTG